MKKKATFLGITAWILMIAIIELIVWWPPNWMAIPLLATGIIGFIAMVILFLRQLGDVLTEIQYQKTEEREKRAKAARGF